MRRRPNNRVEHGWPGQGSVAHKRNRSGYVRDDRCLLCNPEMARGVELMALIAAQKREDRPLQPPQRIGNVKGHATRTTSLTRLMYELGDGDDIFEDPTWRHLGEVVAYA